jgi:hypothetical protein
MNNLSNTGLEEINATDITTNNITILSSLTVNGENIVNKINIQKSTTNFCILIYLYSHLGKHYPMS